MPKEITQNTQQQQEQQEEEQQQQQKKEKTKSFNKNKLKRHCLSPVSVSGARRQVYDV